MNKSSLLLLPTVLAVSASARTKPAKRESAKIQNTIPFRTKPKNLSIDFVFTVGK